MAGDQGLQRLKARQDPAGGPGVDGGLVGSERLAQRLADAQIVQRMDITADQGGHGAHPGAIDGVGRQQGWRRMGVLKPFQNGGALGQNNPVHLEGGHHTLGIERDEGLRPLGPGPQIDPLLAIGQTLEGEGNAGAVGGS